MDLDFPTAQFVVVCVIIVLATLANRARTGEHTGAMIFGLALLSVPALFGAAGYGWPGFAWGALGTLVLMKLMGR
jgi:hypothetical protein